MVGDTIAAIASAAGHAGVGVVRVSGPQAAEITAGFFPKIKSQQARVMGYGSWSSAQGEAMDQVLCVRFDAPASYTGEDMVEVHAHGGRLNLTAILRGLLDAGARPAEPGEFTRRAFVNGKLDLTQAEAVADLITAKAERSRAAAAKQLSGGLFGKVESWRKRVMDLSAQSEAAVDFPDEQDQIAPQAEQGREVSALLNEMQALLATEKTGRLLRNGIRVAIVGRPNVGKSSLLNTLLGMDRAIVTDVAGTTRDFLEESVQVDGVPVVLVDTAGLRDSDDAVESEGVRRSREQMQNADLRLLVLDRSQVLSAEDEVLLKETPAPRLLLANKADLDEAWDSMPHAEPVLAVSAKSQLGISEVMESILRTATNENLDEMLQQEMLTQQRHADALRKAIASMQEVEKTLGDSKAGPELAAVDLRATLDWLGEIVGRTTRAEVLNLIFEKFCIGK